MKVVLYIVVVLLVLPRLTFFLQGINAGIMMVIASGLVVFARRGS